MDRLAEHRSDESLKPRAGGDVAAELTGQMVAVTRQLIDLAGGRNLILVVQACTTAICTASPLGITTGIPNSFEARLTQSTIALYMVI